ncbi:MAG: metal ABC transporter permease, partial [Planctomycetaceae bacterium]|nr:metal ABC transporter permease [Planctomycetaceae bacterium]
MKDHNTRVVVLGTVLLGAAAGVVGCFTLLRRRALMGDALSHATLPGVCLAFLLAPSLGQDPRSLSVLLCGATISGVGGIGCILFIRRLPRLREDAALCIVLSVFFGAGIVLLSVVQNSSQGNAAGLESFIYGKTASMRSSDAMLIGVAGTLTVVVIVLLLKELTLLCFDEGFAGARGFPVLLLDLILMSLVVAITIVGLQAVGLVLMIALLVIPSAAARFWTHDLQRTLLASGILGAASGLIGAVISAVLPRLPSGAMIVLVAGALFLISMLVGRER